MGLKSSDWQKAGQAIAAQREAVGKAAAAFESRWTELSLRRLDPELARRLHEQRNLFHAACLKGAAGEVELQGAALCRGYTAVTKRMEEAGIEDDAYQLGQDPATGTRVAIGIQKAAVDRVRQARTCWITPDQVA